MNLRNLVAVQAEPQEYLGYLAWYTVAECQIRREALAEALRAAGLEETWLPPEIRPADAFRRATREIERKNVPDPARPGVFYNFLVREVASEPHEVQRNLVRETVDARGRRLAYEPEEGVLVLDRRQSRITARAATEEARRLCREAVDLYEIHRTHHDARAVRRMVQAILSGMAPVPVRPSGGVYFVPAKYGDDLSRLMVFLKGLGGRSEGFSVPVVDTAEARDMVRLKLRHNLEDTVASLARTLRRGDADRREVSAALDQARAALGRFREYRQVLEEELADMADLVRFIENQARTLLDRLDGGPPAGEATAARLAV